MLEKRRDIGYDAKISATKVWTKERARSRWPDDLLHLEKIAVLDDDLRLIAWARADTT